MNNLPERESVTSPLDVGEYCRGVEEHLARVNQGHIIRIVGLAFDLVRSWAIEGIPQSIVCRGIDRKAERHRAGRSKRPLRLEFCETDVRELHEEWRRAVGVWIPDAGPADDRASSPVVEERRRPSATRQMDRAIDRIVAAAGRLELPEGLRDDLAGILDRLVALRDELRQVRGAARQRLVERAARIDREVGAAARRAAGSGVASVEREAARELAPFRGRLAADAWQRSVDAGVDRILREQYGLPVLEIALPPATDQLETR